MELTYERKQALLRYCSMDGAEDLSEADPEDLENIQDAYWTAVAYMAGAGVKEPREGTDRWHLWWRCIKALVLDEVDQRGAQTEGSSLQDNKTFQRIKNQLKLTAVPKSGTAEEGGT